MRNRELEALIAEHPDDPENYRVLADWLEGNGDIRATLIRMMLGVDTRHGLTKPMRKLLADHRVHLLGPLSRFARSLRWRWGFVEHVQLGDELGPIEENLETLLVHPATALLGELVIATRYFDRVLPQIGARLPETLRSLTLSNRGDTCLALHQLVAPRLANLALYGGFAFGVETWRALSGLEQLQLSAHSTIAAIHAPKLQGLELAITLDAPTAHAIATAHWPALERLELDVSRGTCEVAAIAPFFAREDMTALRHFSFTNAPYGDELCRLVAHAPFAPQLAELDLVGATLTEAGVAHLLDGKFPALKRLRLDPAGLDESLLELLEPLGLDESWRYHDAGE